MLRKPHKNHKEHKEHKEHKIIKRFWCLKTLAIMPW